MKNKKIGGAKGIDQHKFAERAGSVPPCPPLTPCLWESQSGSTLRARLVLAMCWVRIVLSRT